MLSFIILVGLCSIIAQVAFHAWLYGAIVGFCCWIFWIILKVKNGKSIDVFDIFDVFGDSDFD